MADVLSVGISSKEYAGLSEHDSVVVLGLEILESDDMVTRLVYNDAKFVQTESCTENMVAVQPYGSIIIPVNDENTDTDATISLAIDIFDVTPEIADAPEFIRYVTGDIAIGAFLEFNQGDVITFYPPGVEPDNGGGGME